MNYSSKKTIGELQEPKKFVLDWKINITYLLFGDASFHSPPFTFADRSWHLFVSRDYNDILIALVLESSGPPKSLTYSFDLKTIEGKKFQERLYSDVFEPFKLQNVHSLIRKCDFFPSCPCNQRAEQRNDIVIIRFRTGYSKFPNDSGSDSIPQHALEALSRNKTLQDMKELFHIQEYCDVTLKVKEQEFQAHKAILCARSSVFAATFRHDVKERATGIVDIKDCDPDYFPDFLCFLYCGDIQNLSVENVFSLFVAADKYDVQELRSRCLEFMKNNLSVDTFCDTLTMALQHSEKELTDLTVHFLARNMHDVVETSKWQSFLVSNTTAGNEILIKALEFNKK